MIRKGSIQDIDQVEGCYEELMRYEEEREGGPLTIWRRGVYPTRKLLERRLTEGTLYLAEEDGEVCACVVIDGNQEEDYAGIGWSCAAPPDEVRVVHLLCVRPSRTRQGLGEALLRFAAGLAKQEGCRTVRLDTSALNSPANRLYRKMGYTLAGKNDLVMDGRLYPGAHLFLEYRVE